MFWANKAIAEKYNYLEEKFLKAYKWLRETDIMALEAGSDHSIDGDKVYAQVRDYTTILPEEGKFEAHNKYFDIQYVAAGQEMFGICRREDLVLKEQREEKDVFLYEEPDLSGVVLLKEGDMIVVAPEDAHKPKLQAGGPCKVRKVIVKVAV